MEFKTFNSRSLSMPPELRHQRFAKWPALASREDCGAFLFLLKNGTSTVQDFEISFVFIIYDKNVNSLTNWYCTYLIVSSFIFQFNFLLLSFLLNVQLFSNFYFFNYSTFLMFFNFTVLVFNSDLVFCNNLQENYIQFN